MKNVSLLLVLMSACIFTSAQKPVVTLDHIGMYVRNLDSSVAFYCSLLKLDSMPNTWKNYRVKWYKMGGHLNCI